MRNNLVSQEEGETKNFLDLGWIIYPTIDRFTN